MTPVARRRIVSAVAAVVITVAAMLLASQSARTASGALPSALPVVGPLDAESTVFGAISEGADAGESWAYRRLPLDAPPALVDGNRLEFGPVDPLSATGQLGFFKSSGESWNLAAVPLDTSGRPMRGPDPARRGVRMDRFGSAITIGRDGSRPAGHQLVVIARNPGGAFRELEAPPASVLRAAGDPDPADPAEVLAGNQGIGDVVATVATGSGHAVLFDVPRGRDSDTAAIVNDGTGGAGAWSREPLDTGGETFSADAIDSSGSTASVWIAGHTPSKPLVVMRRTPGAPGTWRRLDLPSDPLTDSVAAASAGITDLAPLGGRAQTLTVSGVDTAWVDLSYTKDGVTRFATVFIDAGRSAADRVESWCDESFCDHELGFDFDTRNGYRSFAWNGSGHGTRVVTNPLREGDGPDSNSGTWMRLSGNTFQRMLGGGGNYRPSGAFSSDSAGWIQGPVRIDSNQQAPARFVDWPTSARAPFTAVVAEPSDDPAAPAVGSIARGALAVGLDGQVSRYSQAGGWKGEFLQSSSGAVVSANLRGVAWPEPDIAFAVGDLGAMWRWRSDTGLWERDPGAPVGLEQNLMGIAFDPADRQRGYAVGKGGTLLAYGKTWTQEDLPPAYADAKFVSIAFAGSEAIAVSDVGVLFNSGSGWKTDAGLEALLGTLSKASIELNVASGLPDGSAVIGGRSLVVERDGASGPWTFAPQPLPGSTVVAASAFKGASGSVSAVVSVVRRLDWPLADPQIEPDPNSPPPVMPPYLLPGDGYVLRQTDSGWRDEQRTGFAGSGPDRPLKTDPILAFLLDQSGAGWGVGGWSGFGDDVGRGAPVRSSSATALRRRVQTASIDRYDPAGDPAAPAAAIDSPVPLPAGPIRIAVGGHPQCESACADLANQDIAPDKVPTAALDEVASLAARPNGPTAFISTGSRIRVGSGFEGDPDEETRYARLFASRTGLPVYSALAGGDIADGSAASFRAAFAGAPAPMGSGDPGSSITKAAVPSLGPTGSGARTHYAFDISNPQGPLRVVVIDNSAGSLVASDSHQNPAEPQEQWLINVLDDAAAKRIPAIVVGNKDLNSRIRPSINLADDADHVAKLLVAHGASAYVCDRPEENRRSSIPAGSPNTIPEFATGSLGYRSSVANSASLGLPDSLFGSSGFLLLEIDPTRRDDRTNIAPASVRLIPVVDNLSMLALDGNQVRRSRPALFEGIGRRPVAGDRWGAPGGDSIPDPAGADPYTPFPGDPCRVSGCSTRIDPEYTFTSRDPDLLDFVAPDPASSNLRKPLIGLDDKVIHDSSSGLACPYNSGDTVVTLAAGGKGYSMPVEVLGGSVLRPCGTVPLNPSRFETSPEPNPDAAAPPPAASPLPATLPALIPPPPPSLFSAFFLGGAALPPTAPPVSPPPPPPTFFANPVPPGGSTVRVEKREEEIAPESSSAASAYRADDHLPIEPFVLGMMVLAALAGTTVRPGRRRDPAYATTRVRYPERVQRNRPYGGHR